jgi:molybdopterin molybdotransferase
MDGYALRFDDVPQPPVRLRNTGISRAGERFAGALSAGQCVRIFTDGVVPPGADVIVLQEDATESESDVIIDKIPKKGAHIRYAGLDFCFDQVCVPVQGKSVSQACRDAGISLLMRMTTAEKKRQRS